MVRTGDWYFSLWHSLSCVPKAVQKCKFWLITHDRTVARRGRSLWILLGKAKDWEMELGQAQVKGRYEIFVSQPHTRLTFILEGKGFFIVLLQNENKSHF